jgi:hypothetical protein
MQATRRAMYKLSTGALLFAVFCIGTVSLCGWFAIWHLSGTYLKPLFLLVVLFSLALLTTLRQIWKTRRCMQALLCLAVTDLPPHVHTLIAQRGINRSSLILMQSPEPLAFCYGFLKPRICLSTGLVELLSPSQLQAVLFHEDYHRQRFDPLRILLVRAVGTALFFLPFVREWCRLFEINLELDADRYAVRQTSRAALAGALYHLLNPSPTTPSVSGAGVITAGLSASTVRIAALLGERSKPGHISLRSVIHSTAVLWVICLLLML